MGEEIFPWLKCIPLAPEYHPTFTEFQDPISYIFKIEKEASPYGICKIIPPIPPSSKKVTIANLNRSLSLANRGLSPTFTTRLQDVGFSPRRHQRPAQRLVWESGEKYTLAKFEAKAKKIEKKILPIQDLTPLKIETLYWKAQGDRPISVEYANDMPGSAFQETGAEGGGVKQGRKKVCDVMTVGDTLWNLRRIAKAKGSLLRFKEEDIAGVTSPMIYMGMLYSWFAWHVEDHDLHSLNYMHMGAGKTWYGVPINAASAFEDVVRTQAFGGERSPAVTFATLVGKTTIVSPEVLVKAGVPCFRLVQNPGEFVVTFPRAYHSGFSHGFNCAEAVNMATPGWLPVAREAAIRRASIDLAPMVSDSQLLYDLAMSMSSSKQKNKPLSWRPREMFKSEGDAFVKRTFVQDVMHSNELLDALGNGSPITRLSQDVLKRLVPYGFNMNVDDNVVDRRPKRIFDSSYGQPNKKADPACIFSCVTCGSPCYSCVAIVQPSETAAHYLMSNDDANVIDPGLSSGKLLRCSSSTQEQKDIPAVLKLLALTYGDSSDLEEDFEPTQLVLESKHSLIGIRPMYSSASEQDASRLHVFCLDHAREVEQRLRSVGGVQMLLLCHQDYPKMNDAAREMGEELGILDDMWIDVKYKNITKQDKTMIQWALDDEETATGNQDWAVKLGIDIFYSAKLVCSPLYKKQMPNNAVICNAFRQDSPSNDQSGRRMSNRVHPMLVVRDDDDNNDNDDIQQELHQKVSLFPETNVRKEKHSEVRTSTRKRKRTLKGKFLEVEASSPPLSPATSEDGSDYDPSESSKRRITRKPARKLEVGNKSKTRKNQDQAKKGKKAHVIAISDEEEGTFSSDIDGCDMSFESNKDLNTHNQNFFFVVGCEKHFLSHKSLQQHRRVQTVDRPLKCPWQGCKMACTCAWAQTEYLRVHTKEPPYVYAEDECGQRFRFVSDFNLHRSETDHA